MVQEQTASNEPANAAAGYEMNLGVLRPRNLVIVSFGIKAVIAGAMTALIPKETITRFLGRNTPKFISYPAAALAGSLLAVCSCTIVPLFAGIYKKGGGLGPAITFLFFAPAANILALVYTGGVIGGELAFA